MMILQFFLGGGLGECSSSTIDIPDLDLNNCWYLNRDVLNCLNIVPVNDSGFYKIEVDQAKSNNNHFKSVFGPYVTSIQTHGAGMTSTAKLETPTVSYLFAGDDGKTYLNSNLMRNQMNGLLGHLKNIKMEERDYSNTGAARTVLLRYCKVINTTCNLWVKFFLSIFPDVEVDYVPQFVIPYEYLPANAKIWHDRQSSLLTNNLKNKIKCRGGGLVAKYEKDCGENSSITWRISLSPMDLLHKDAYSGCNVIEVLIILKDIRKVAFSQFCKHDLSTYFIKTSLLWSMEEKSHFGRHELIDATLRNLSYFYSRRHLPDFFNAQCNLIKSVPKETAKDISDISENVRTNIDTVITACKTKHVEFIRKQKSDVSTVVHKICSIRVFILKLFLSLMIWFPFLSNYVMSKCFNYILVKILFGINYLDFILKRKKYPYKLLNEILLNKKDSHLQYLLSKAGTAICNTILKVLE